MAVSHKLKTIRTEEIDQFHPQTQAALFHAHPLLSRDIGRRHASPSLYNPFASQVDLERGFSKEEVRLILRGNFLRVLRRVCG